MAATSMFLGVLEAIMGFFVKIFANITMFLIKTLIDILSPILYGIGGTLLGIVDFIQKLFRQFAGIDSIWYGSSNPKKASGDILLYVLSEKTVIQVFLALVLVSIAVLLMGTIIKIIQSEYTTEGANNSKAGIVGNAIKGFMMFIIVPVGVFGGLYASNFILQAIDKATNPSGSIYMGGAVFSAATTDASRFTTVPETEWTIANGKQTIAPWGRWVNSNGDLNPSGGFFQEGNLGNVPQLKELEGSVSSLTGAELSSKVAEIVEDWFVRKVPFSKVLGNSSQENVNWYNFSHKVFDATFADAHQSDITGSYHTYNFDYTAIDHVIGFYMVTNVNYIILYGAGLLAAYCMLMAIFGLINRIFKGAILFMVSPISVSTYPFDNGSGLSSWRKKFFGNAISAYGTVISLNLLFVILPILKNIKLFDPAVPLNRALNSFVYLLLVLCALLFFKDAPGFVSSLIGADNAMADGSKAFETVGKAVAGVATGGVKFAANKAMAAKNAISGKIHKNKAEDLKKKAEDATDPNAKEKLLKAAEKEEKKAKSQESKRADHHAKARKASANMVSSAVGTFNSVTGASDVAFGQWKPKTADQIEEARDKRKDRFVNAAAAAAETRVGQYAIARDNQRKERNQLASNIADITGQKKRDIKKDLKNKATYAESNTRKKLFEAAHDETDKEKVQHILETNSTTQKALGNDFSTRKETWSDVKNPKAKKGIGSAIGAGAVEILMNGSIPHGIADIQAANQQTEKVGNTTIDMVQNIKVEMTNKNITDQRKELDDAIAAGNSAKAEELKKSLSDLIQKRTEEQAKIIQEKLSKLDEKKDKDKIAKLLADFNKIKDDMKKDIDEIKNK